MAPLKALISALLASLCLQASAQATPPPACRVLDPELAMAYQGDCHNGLAEGTAQARGTAHYQGQFQAGKKHGQGTKTWPNGDRYDGQFNQDQKHGEGRYEWGPRALTPGARYQGQFQQDRRDGPGRYTTPEGLALETTWFNDQPLGPFPPQWQAYIRHQAALAAALTTGTKACKRLTLGLATEDLIEAVVQTPPAQGYSARITKPGNHPQQSQDGTLLAAGHTLQDRTAGWVPCKPPAIAP